MKLHLSLALILFLACAATLSSAEEGAVSADTATRERLFDAKFLLGRERNAEAAAIYRELIDQGVPEAMWRMGAMLQAGKLGSPDENEGRTLFQRAAANGGKYQCEVGVMLFYGVDGVERDPEEGRRLIQDAIQGGYVAGYHYLAILEEDPAARASLLREGVDRGSADCGLALGLAYLDGRGVPTNRDAGVKYLVQAADADPSFLSRALAGLIDTGDVEAGTLLRLAEKLEQHCLVAGDPDLAPAFLELSDMFRNGIVFERDGAKADFWLEQAKNFGDNTLLAALADRSDSAPEPDSPKTTPVVITNQDVYHHRYEVAMTEGDRLADLENWDGALERYEAARAIHGYDKDATALAAIRLAREKIGNQVVRKREAAIAAFNRDDYDTAFDIFSELYDQDDPEVYAYLGRCFEEGLGTGKDYEEALYWAGLAAERNNPIGLNTLGVCYDHGRGVERDRAEAMRYFKQAADQGYPAAMVNLGLHYENGYATAVNLPEAARLYRLAAETGLYKGQFHYARSLFLGNGVAVNDAEAFSRFSKAAEGGNAGAYFYLGYMYSTGRGVRQDYSRAIEWYNKAAAGGEVGAMNNLGAIHMSGQGVPRNPDEAIRWYRLAAEAGDATGQNNLANALFEGKAGYYDYNEAAKWYRLAADQGVVNAIHRLGHVYYEGKGALYDDEEAWRWFYLAAEKGHVGCDTSRAIIGY